MSAMKRFMENHRVALKSMDGYFIAVRRFVIYNTNNETVIQGAVDFLDRTITYYDILDDEASVTLWTFEIDPRPGMTSEEVQGEILNGYAAYKQFQEENAEPSA